MKNKKIHVHSFPFEPPNFIFPIPDFLHTLTIGIKLSELGNRKVFPFSITFFFSELLSRLLHCELLLLMVLSCCYGPYGNLLDATVQYIALLALEGVKLHPLYFPDFLLQPIRIHGFATLNTTLYYREHTLLTVTLFAFGPWWEFCLGAVGAFGLRAISFGGSPAFTTGEFTVTLGGSPGLLLQVNFLRWVTLLPPLLFLAPTPQ